MHDLLTESFMTEEEAAGLLGVTVRSLRTYASRRQGPPRVKMGRRVLYRKNTLLGWIARQEIDPEAARRRAVGE